MVLMEKAEKCTEICLKSQRKLHKRGKPEKLTLSVWSMSCPLKVMQVLEQNVEQSKRQES